MGNKDNQQSEKAQVTPNHFEHEDKNYTQAHKQITVAPRVGFPSWVTKKLHHSMK